MAFAPINYSDARWLVHAVFGATSGNAHGVASLLFDCIQIEAAVSTAPDIEYFSQFHPALEHHAGVVCFSHCVCRCLCEVDAAANDAVRSWSKSISLNALAVLFRCAMVELFAPFDSVGGGSPQLLQLVAQRCFLW